MCTRSRLNTSTWQRCDRIHVIVDWRTCAHSHTTFCLMCAGSPQARVAHRKRVDPAGAKALELGFALRVDALPQPGSWHSLIVRCWLGEKGIVANRLAAMQIPNHRICIKLRLCHIDGGRMERPCLPGKAVSPAPPGTEPASISPLFGKRDQGRAVSVRRP